MTIDDRIRDGKLQNDINREAAKISALSSNKIDKYGYLTDEEILPSNRNSIQNQGKIKTIKKYTHDNEDSPLTSKQKEIFNKLVDE